MANIIPITSFSAPELDVFARLTENQLVNRADPANAPTPQTQCSLRKARSLSAAP